MQGCLALEAVIGMRNKRADFCSRRCASHEGALLSLDPR